MYNETLKQSFLNEYGSKTSKVFFLRLFEKSATYEQAYEKDVSNFVLDQILDLLKSFGATSIESLRADTSRLRVYTDYCIQHNMSIDSQNHYDSITTPLLKKCLNMRMAQKKFISEETLWDIIDLLQNPCDKYIILAIYEGMYGEQFSEVTLLDKWGIDEKEQKFILSTERDFYPSKELFNIALNAVNTFEYSGNEKTIPLSESDYTTFKTSKNASFDDVEHRYKRLLRRIHKIKTMLEMPALTLPRIRNSGMITMAMKEAEEYGITNPEEVFMLEKSELVDKIRDQYRTYQPAGQLRQMYRDYML